MLQNSPIPRPAGPALRDEPDLSNWTARLGYSLHEGLRRALCEVEPNPDKREAILRRVKGEVTRLATTNDLYTGTRDGISIAISFRDVNGRGKGEVRLGLRMPSGQIVFVKFIGKANAWTRGFKDPGQQFNYWWWQKHSGDWFKQLKSRPEAIAAEDYKSFAVHNQQIISPGTFWNHVERVPSRLPIALTGIIIRAYHDADTAAKRKAGKNYYSRLRQKLLLALNAMLAPAMQAALAAELSAWQEQVQLGSATAKYYLDTYPHSYAVTNYFSNCSAEVCERRDRFAQTFPFMMPLLLHAAAAQEKNSETARRLLIKYGEGWKAVIDGNGKFTQQAAQDLSVATGASVTPALVKRIAAMPAAFATKPHSDLLFSNLGRLAQVPIQLVPADPQALLDLTRNLKIASVLLELLGQPIRTMAAHAGKNLAVELARLGKSSSRDIKDFIEAVIGRLVLAFAARRAAEAGVELTAELARSCSELKRDTILQRAVQSRSALRLAEGSDAWHKGGQQNNFLNQLETLRQAAGGLEEWPPLTPAVSAPNGYRLVPLTCNQQLREEGKLLDHCVGGYGWRCISNRSHIISVRTRQGERHSTLEVEDGLPKAGEVVVDETLFQVAQHNAYHNSAPDREAQAAVAWYLGHLREGKLPVDFTAIQQARAQAKRQEARSLVLQKLGYDPAQGDKADELYAVCRSYLPSHWAKPTLDETIKALQIAAPICAALDLLVPQRPQLPPPSPMTDRPAA